MDEIALAASTTNLVEVTAKQKVVAGLAITAYLGACYAGGFLVGKLIERGVASRNPTASYEELV